MTLVAMTSSFTPLLKSVSSSTTKLLPLRTAIESLFRFLISYPEWLIPIPPLSLGGSCKHTTSALRSTPIFSAAMVHSYDLAQLCWITPIIGSQGSRFGIHFDISRGPDRSLNFGHCDVSCPPPVPPLLRPRPPYPLHLHLPLLPPPPGA